MKKLFIPVVLCLMLAACASRNLSQEMETMLNPHIGRLTYDEAVMMWGVPDSEIKTASGIIAQWIKVTPGNAAIIPVGMVRVIKNNDRSERLTIMFADGVMREWSWEMR